MQVGTYWEVGRNISWVPMTPSVSKKTRWNPT